MASGWGEGTVQPWRAPPLELTKWSKTTQEDMCVCVCVYMCRDLHFCFMYATDYTHPVPYNLGIYCLEFTMAYTQVSYNWVLIIHIGSIDICIHDQSKLKMKIELWKP
jgi:hypothetical protein